MNPNENNNLIHMSLQPGRFSACSMHHKCTFMPLTMIQTPGVITREVLTLPSLKIQTHSSICGTMDLYAMSHNAGNGHSFMSESITRITKNSMEVEI
jgi:hypothetical protein